MAVLGAHFAALVSNLCKTSDGSSLRLKLIRRVVTARTTYHSTHVRYLPFGSDVQPGQ